MVGKVTYSSLFIIQLDDLAQILYTKKYFSFIEDVDQYIDKIYDFVENNIEHQTTKVTPSKFHQFGKKFIKYRANTNTTWYIFFDQKDNQFIINHILNNHSHDFPELL